MPAHQEPFNVDFWIGVITAAPVLMIAEGALLAPISPLVARWASRAARGFWIDVRVMAAAIFVVGSNVIFFGAKILALHSLADRADYWLSPGTTASVMAFAVIALVGLLTMVGLSATDTDRPKSTPDPAPVQSGPRSEPVPRRPGLVVGLLLLVGYLLGSRQRD